MKPLVCLSILFIWAYSTCFDVKKAQKSNEQVEWFDLIGDMAYYKRNFVFSPFLALKTPFLARNGVKIHNFENSKKVPLDILEIHVSSSIPIY